MRENRTLHPVQLLGIAALLLLPGCERLGTLSSAELSGTVYVRNGAGQTLPQGGLELRLLAEEAKANIESLQAQYERYQSRRMTLLSKVEGQRAALLGESSRRLKSCVDKVLPKIRVSVSAARPDYKFPLIRLALTVSNQSDFTVSSLSYQLFCGDVLIPPDVTGLSHVDTSNPDDMSEPLVIDEPIEPGSKLTIGSPNTFYSDWRIYPLPKGIQNTEQGKQLSACSRRKLRVKVVSLWCETNRGKSQILCCHGLPFTQEDAEENRRAFRAVTSELNDVDTAVASLDVNPSAIIEKETRQVTRTDVGGTYRFVGLKPGPYVVYARYSSALEEGTWFVRVDVSGAKIQDLSNFNLSKGNPLFTPRWTAWKAATTPPQIADWIKPEAPR